jgi:imidazole glycerol-phosphate synthase subunit HisH
MIAIIDYETGNLGSVRNMLARIGAEACITADPALVARADKLILPGVGSFDEAMASLRACPCLPLVQRRVLEEGIPILGICLGMQLFGRASEEGGSPGLGWIPGEVRRLRVPPALPVPHMGWNTLEPAAPLPLLEGLGPDARFYFAHSYHLVCDDPRDAAAWTRYGEPFTAVLARGNILGTQFHPEKSLGHGMKVLKNFTSM